MPEVTFAMPLSMFIVVVLPVQFGPEKPNISTGLMLKLILSTATKPLYDFFKSCTSNIFFITFSNQLGGMTVRLKILQSSLYLIGNE